MFCRATPYEGKEPYIFISYCSADQEAVYPLIEQMSLNGYRVWYDAECSTGYNWLLSKEEHLEKCSAVIAFVSGHSRDSANCNKEIIYAMKCRKKIVPVRIDNAALPKGLRMQLEGLHSLDRKNFPSDKDLLKKCCEPEDCQKCLDPSGSIPLRPQESVHSQKSGRKGTGYSFLIDMHQIDPGKKEPKQDTPPVTAKNPPKEDTPTACTVIPGFGLTGNETVSGNDPYGITVLTRTNGIDEDKTVRISRNLVILLHPAERKAYKLTNPKITVGRSQIRCDVAIEGNDTISKVHAVIRQTRQQCYIEDMNSANGTFIKGEQIESGKQIPLDNPAVFQLNDETLILLSGPIAREFSKKTSVSLLINEDNLEVRILDGNDLPLNRRNQWPEGTLSDPKIHRAAHALLKHREDGFYLIDESPVNGNDTCLNGIKMRHGDMKLLSSGDRIRLGDTVLEFISVEIPS